jgi:hypothetical protein
MAASAAVVSAVLTAAAHAQVVIDFNGLPGVHDLLLDGPYSEDGYTLTSTAAGEAATVNGFQPNGLYLAGTTEFPQIVRLMNAAGDRFDLRHIGIGDNSHEENITFAASNGAIRAVSHFDLAIGITFDVQWRNLAWVNLRVVSSPFGGPGQLTADNITITTTCAADFSDDGVLNSQDLFDFLTAFFGGEPRADFNADGGINSQGFFDFLGAFVAGCP